MEIKKVCGDLYIHCKTNNNETILLYNICYCAILLTTLSFQTIKKIQTLALR